MTRILFVEDEPWGVNAYFNTLERKGMKCNLAHSYQEALKLIAQHRFDILSLDVMFTAGKFNGSFIEHREAGLHLLNQIRNGSIKNCSPDIKVIVLTAIPSHHVEQRMKTLQIAHYLKKPIAFDEVIAIFTQLAHDRQEEK